MSATTAGRGGRRLTLRVNWRGVHVGNMHHNLWREGLLLGYRFSPWDPKNVRFACPPEFDVSKFCSEHGGLDPAVFNIYQDQSGSYLRLYEAEVALRLLRTSAQRIDEVIFGRQSGHTSDLKEALAAIVSNEALTPTTREQLIDARLGQGQFRQNLERIFGGRCAVTGLQLPQVLRASHVLAWSQCSDRQRLDPHNGLLLSANLDALFDRHLITFDRSGHIRVSLAITADELSLLGPLGNLRCKPTVEQWEYLQQHKAAFEEAQLRQRRIAADA